MQKKAHESLSNVPAPEWRALEDVDKVLMRIDGVHDALMLLSAHSDLEDVFQGSFYFLSCILREETEKLQASVKELRRLRVA